MLKLETLVPSYVANMPNLVIWVNLGRIAVIGVLIVGYIQSYKAIKNKAMLAIFVINMT